MRTQEGFSRSDFFVHICSISPYQQPGFLSYSSADGDIEELSKWLLLDTHVLYDRASLSS